MVVTPGAALTLSKSSGELAGPAAAFAGSFGGLGALSGTGNPAMNAGGALPPVGGPLVHQGSLRRRSKTEIAHQVRRGAVGRPTTLAANRQRQWAGAVGPRPPHEQPRCPFRRPAPPGAPPRPGRAHGRPRSDRPHPAPAFRAPASHPPPPPLPPPSPTCRLRTPPCLLQFLANLRARGSVEVDDTLEQEIVQHFESLPSRCGAASRPQAHLVPAATRVLALGWRGRCAHRPLRTPALCRYALDVNISSLDVLNHKRLLDSARADPSAVSFQLRPVDVVSGSDIAKRPSFGSLDTLQLQSAEVRRAAGRSALHAAADSVLMQPNSWQNRHALAFVSTQCAWFELPHGSPVCCRPSQTSRHTSWAGGRCRAPRLGHPPTCRCAACVGG